MGWDADRPVPWTRLVREYLIYAAIMAAILFLFFRDGGVAPLLGGVFAAGPIYVLFGAVLAKFGYQRKTLAELRTPRAPATPSTTSDAATGRAKPAPTRRTSGGGNRPASGSSRKRR